ncbi:MAG: recombinase family protein [Patescibacteria group bacterium]
MQPTNQSYLSPFDQRVQAVLHSRRGLPLFGYVYDNVDRRHLPDPIRFPIVKRLFELAAQGIKLRFILKELSAMEGFVTIARGGRGGRPIPRQNLYAMLRDPFYAGMVEWEGRLYEGIHESVVSWDVFLRAQPRMNRVASTGGANS